MYVYIRALIRAYVRLRGSGWEGLCLWAGRAFGFLGFDAQVFRVFGDLEFALGVSEYFFCVASVVYLLQYSLVEYIPYIIMLYIHRTKYKIWGLGPMSLGSLT